MRYNSCFGAYAARKDGGTQTRWQGKPKHITGHLTKYAEKFRLETQLRSLNPLRIENPVPISR